jgi:Na+-translocating ferredoxin:NAD+ oxidoreductase RNF subunit RnfB
MTRAREVLNAHPGTAAIDADALIECIEACFDCSQACSACADAGLGEEMVSHMRRCMTMCLNCSDQCATTGRILSRQTESESAMARTVRIMCAVVTVFLRTTPSRAPARNRSR